MMLQRYLICLFFSLFYTLSAQSQAIHQAKWQQEVNYDIQLKLFPKERMLRAQLKLEYVNHSGDTLRELFIHQWPNAYRSTATPFGRQILTNGKLDFEYAEKEQRGFLDSTNWYSQQGGLTIERVDEYGEIIRIIPDHPILPGATFNLESPFRVKIPDVFSRMGYGKGTWQITQWYPKVAVYDTNGWHPMPYLDQGEFYSDFGTYRVQMQVPANMLVAATGVLKTESEKDFRLHRLNNPIESFDNLIPPGSTYKTIVFEQDRVHDFAWFASTNYNIVKSITHNSLGDSIECWVFGCDAPQNLSFTKAIESALGFFGEMAGDYPYSHCTVVKGELEAGGGMEYPMITVCDVMNDEVIVHEVGHNWFQGMLATNERRYPWMDESINSFVENECLKAMEKENVGSTLTQTLTGIAAAEKDVLLEGQAIGDASEEFSWPHYGLYIYGKGAAVFESLQAYLGKDLFRACMRYYFQSWQYRHPLPGDMKRAFEDISEQDLSWFFDEWIDQYKPFDLAIKSVNTALQEDGSTNIQLEINNPDRSHAPFELNVYQKDSLISSQWISHSGDARLNISINQTLAEGKYRILLNTPSIMPEYRNGNNHIRLQGLLKKVEPIQLSPALFLDRPEKTQIFWLPLYAWNATNRHMAGLLLHNRGVPTKRFHYRFTPLYSFETNNLNGYGFLKTTLPLRRGKLKALDFNVYASSFAFRHFNDRQQFQLYHPQMVLNYRKASHRSLLTHKTFFTLRRSMFSKLGENSNAFTPKRSNASMAEIKHSIVQKRVKNPWDASLSAQYGDINGEVYSRIHSHLRYTFSYKEKNKGLEARLFGGWLPVSPNDAQYQFRAGMNNGTYDAWFEHVSPGRGMGDGLWSRQVLYMEDFAKYRGDLGNANEWLTSLNLRSTLPGKIPVQLYADLLSFNGLAALAEENMVYNAGLMISILDQRLEIYIPLLRSDVIEQVQEINGIDTFGERITFRLDLNRLNPFEVYKDLNLY